MKPAPPPGVPVLLRSSCVWLSVGEGVCCSPPQLLCRRWEVKVPFTCVCVGMRACVGGGKGMRVCVCVAVCASCVRLHAGCVGMCALVHLKYCVCMHVCTTVQQGQPLRRA